MSNFLRAIAAMLGFVIFGILSIFFTFTLTLPLLLLNVKLRKKIMRKILHFCFIVQTTSLRLFGVMNTVFENTEIYKNANGCLFIANHPSLLDVAVFLSEIPNVDCIVKTSAWKNPFFYIFVTFANYIKNVDSNAIVNTCVERINAGNNILMFPEGSRSYPHELLPFKRGFATIAIMSKAKLVPFVLKCDPPVLTKNTPWYKFPKKKIQFSLIAHEPFNLAEITKNEPENYKASKALLKYTENFYKEKTAT